MVSRLTLSSRFRSLHAQAILHIVLPLSVIFVGLFVVGTYAYSYIATSLVLERHSQLANLAAISVSEIIEGYASVLETLANKPGFQSLLPEESRKAITEAEEVLGIFDAGVFIIDKQGSVITASRDDSVFLLSNLFSGETFYFDQAQITPWFSNVLFGEGNQEAFVLVAVPLFDVKDQVVGKVIGAINLHSSSISKLVRNLTIGQDGFAYLVDRAGTIIAHPDPQTIGADYSNLPYVKRVVAGDSGGMLSEQSEGKRLVEGFAPIRITGWGLVIQESWDSILEPLDLFSVLVVAIGLAIFSLVAILSWRGFERIAAPIQALHDQTMKLAKGDDIDPIKESGITEIDVLDRAFEKMAFQISAYRAGLRRYVGAITRSQEEERRRIARELHDDTIQNLLAISRRLELDQSSENNLEHREKLARLQEMVTQTLVGLRRINRDLRPLILDDLGLIPALRNLVRAARQGEGAIPHAKLETIGQPFPLKPEHELALYRIAQEALANTRRHASATGVLVALAFDSEAVKLEIIDDGIGFVLPLSLTDFAQHDHFGLLGIQERVWAVGGSLSIDSSPSEGTKLVVTIPISNLDPV